MDKLRTKAKELLESKTSDLVIGFEEGSAGRVRPAFISDSQNAVKLIFDERCTTNLSLYLTKREVKKRAKKIAIVAALPVLRSIITLASENQVQEDNIIALTITQDSNITELRSFAEIEKFIHENKPEPKPEQKAFVEKIEQMSTSERWKFWQDEFSQCLKCYACRASCPMCYCEKCTVDCNQPQWISAAQHKLGIFEWHVMRAMHLAGRCINCGQCAEACPVDIPLNLLTGKLNKEVFLKFNYMAGVSVNQEYVLSSFRNDDKENFIK